MIMAIACVELNHDLVCVCYVVSCRVHVLPDPSVCEVVGTEYMGTLPLSCTKPVALPRFRVFRRTYTSSDAPNATLAEKVSRPPTSVDWLGVDSATMFPALERAKVRKPTSCA